MTAPEKKYGSVRSGSLWAWERRSLISSTFERSAFQGSMRSQSSSVLHLGPKEKTYSRYLPGSTPWAFAVSMSEKKKQEASAPSTLWLKSQFFLPVANCFATLSTQLFDGLASRQSR